MGNMYAILLEVRRMKNLSEPSRSSKVGKRDENRGLRTFLTSQHRRRSESAIIQTPVNGVMCINKCRERGYANLSLAKFFFCGID